MTNVLENSNIQTAKVQNIGLGALIRMFNQGKLWDNDEIIEIDNSDIKQAIAEEEPSEGFVI